MTDQSKGNSMSMYERQPFLNEIKKRLLELRFEGKNKVAFWGWDRDLIVEVVSLNAAAGMDFHFYVNDREIDFLDSNSQCRPQDCLGEDAPDLVIIAKKNAIRIFEYLIDRFQIGQRKIVMDPVNWRNKDYTSDPLVWDFYTNVPNKIRGGLSSFEVCAHLWDSLKYLFDRNIPGDLVNLGAYQGWSLYFTAMIRDHFGQQHRKIYGFDTFSGWVPSAAHPFDQFASGAVNIVAGHHLHSDTCLATVQKNLESFKNIELIEGDIRQTITTSSPNQVAFALFDMDDYTPTQVALKPMYEKLSPGGVFLHDHFSYASLASYCTWGQRKAMLDFLQDHPMFNLTGTNAFIKI
ncbi:MAG TPA: TylF/MycF/NovP-related O-methyltransferase [Rhodocyclaceae bacterium]|nr:TylF/MycF/NovP-related O-methyltransferase [Rhodocyclaceae bacterium]